ncbi:hypothetical protein [Flavobacterium laiguense]|uniref:Uncharacterized protein n=1 Tax=Flavobacterium laiguense TaxID=2169409 RepID=A0A2U1K0E8_9FLAO|nr:hypothetical protein [Flavobacterium laiguense]PWA10941.1 hypothetical protein DB891_03680 [Flavobacterium laiguense]
MNYQQKNKIGTLEKWLKENPNHPNRTTIETDLRTLKEEQIDIPLERDTFDLREQNINNV